MPIIVLTVTKSNGEIEHICHQVTHEAYDLYKDVIKGYSSIFNHIRENNDTYPDEVVTLDRLKQKEKEFLDLLHNIDQKVFGCGEIMVFDRISIDLTLPT